MSFTNLSIVFCVLITLVSCTTTGDKKADPATSLEATATSDQSLSHSAIISELSNNQNASDMRIAPLRYVDYSDVWSILAITDSIDEERLRLFYTQSIIPIENRASGTNQNQRDYWNREHVWPQSKGLKGNKSRVDLYNIVPADMTVNSSRSNKYFDHAACSHHECLDCKYDDQRWEPPDKKKVVWPVSHSIWNWFTTTMLRYQRQIFC